MPADLVHDSGEAMIGVRGVVERWLELPEWDDARKRGRRRVQAFGQGSVFLGDVVAVETVEIGEAIVLRRQQRIPGLPGRGHRHRRQRLQHDDLGPEPPPVAAEKLDAGQAADDLVRFLIDVHLPGGVTAQTQLKLAAFLSAGTNREERIREIVHALMTMPEYQLA